MYLFPPGYNLELRGHCHPEINDAQLCLHCAFTCLFTLVTETGQPGEEERWSPVLRGAEAAEGGDGGGAGGTAQRGNGELTPWPGGRRLRLAEHRLCPFPKTRRGLEPWRGEAGPQSGQRDKPCRHWRGVTTAVGHLLLPIPCFPPPPPNASTSP